MQSCFSDVEYASKEVDVARPEATTPWPFFMAAILYFPKSDGRGRPPIELELKLRLTSPSSVLVYLTKVWNMRSTIVRQSVVLSVPICKD